MRTCLSLLIASFSTVGLAIAQDRAAQAAAGLEFPSDGAEAVAFSSRADLESQMMARWGSGLPTSGPGSDPSDFERALANVSETRLMHAATATDFDTFIQRLFGTGRAANPSNLLPGPTVGGAGTPINDMVFVPTTPCRIFDTRFAAAGKMAAAETRSFYTNIASAGSGVWANQGGDASECPDVPFDPPAIVINLTVASPVSNGNVRAFPFMSPVPTASNLNFVTGVNLANAAVVSTCNACGPDMNIFVSQSTHVLADIAGYFRPKDKTVDIHVMNTPNGGVVDTGVDMGLAFGDGQFDVFRTTAFLPEDYSTDTNLTARFLFTVNQTGCTIDWSTNNPLRVLRSGSGTANALTVTPSSSTPTVPATANNVFQILMTVSASAFDMAAGDLLTLSWFRSTDTCTADLIVRGFQLLYN